MARNFGRVNVSITASTGGLTAGLSAASKQLKTFQSSTSGTSASMQAMNAAFGESAGMFSDVPGLFGSFAASLLGVSRGATAAAIGVRVLSLAMKTLLIPLGVVAAVTAPFRWIADAASAAEEMHNLSQETGITASDLQTMSAVAGEFGVSQEQMTSALRRTARMVGALGQGTPSAVKAFQSLGLTMDQFAGMSTAQQFALISQRIAALPTEMQAVAAVDIFGKSGQSMLNFIRDAGKATDEMRKLQQQLGITLTNEQTAAIEAMGDALGRLSMPLQGFINQFLAELAPAITTVSRLFINFFAESTSGFNIAQTLAAGLVQSLRMVVGAVTLLTGIFQLFKAFGSQIGQMFSEVFAVILSGVTRVMRSMARLAEAAGFEGLAASLSEGSRGASELGRGARQMGEMYGKAAATTFDQAVQNMANPFAAFDREFSAAQAEATAAATGSAVVATKAAGDEMRRAIQVSTQELKALVLGTSGGESFRNSILRGADPRLAAADAAKETADNTERTADAVEDLPDQLARAIPLGMATIMA